MSITFSVFAKFYQHLSVRELAGLVREVGLDTTNLVVRDGYWTSEANLAAELPEFVKVMRDEGLEVRFATTGFEADRLVSDPTPVSILAEHGITDFRIGYFRASDDPRAAFDSARASLEKLAGVCAARGVRAVCQVHHGTLVASASAAWHLVNGLPPASIGIELDPGNQSFEGFEDWERSARLLGDYLVAAGVKDTTLARDMSKAGDLDKGWRRSWAPIYEGVTNWHSFAQALAAVDFTGTLVFMPFYDHTDPAAMTAKLKREVAYLREIIKSVGEEQRDG